ncbi:hypothetical protein BSKO_01358 [Bryopsis sp. KO-2023]|nr:hypothetical protein BSKO_01358 [Bryopsis sp. KO-2023]
MASQNALCFSTLGIITALKLLLFPAYHSTDFEVHRNWLAITGSLPLDQWYISEKSEWTLDYPPLFAWLEFLLAKIAAFVDPKMLEVSKEPYETTETIYFQRFSVIILDGALILAAHKASRQLKKGNEILLFALVVGNVGLILVDHVHFQYNGVLIGLLMWSVLLVEDGRYILGGVLFAVLINMKHLFVYAAPLYFVYLLRAHCWGPGCLWNFTKLGASVTAIFALSFGPFLWLGQIKQVMSRLFPFGRGLCHAYWAPNAWALYASLDKGLVVLFGMMEVPVRSESNTAGGLVGAGRFSVLPQIAPSVSLCLVFLAMLPAVTLLWRKPFPRFFLETIAYAFMCGFVWGYHVHEKAILTVLIPVTFAAFRPSIFSSLRNDLLHFSTVAHYSLLPLFFGAQEYPIKLCLVVIYCMLVHVSMNQDSRTGNDGWLGKWACRVQNFHLWGLILVEVYCSLLHRLLFDEALPFVPLMLTSFYCGVGVLWHWGKWGLNILHEISVDETREKDKKR